MRVYLTNLGCKLNQAELEQLARRFHGAGHRLVGSLAEADLHVVNTCNVTHLAARDSRKIARRGRRLNPQMRTVLTGCYVAAEPNQAARLAGVDVIVPNRDKHRLVQKVHQAFPEAIPTSQACDPVPVPFVPLEFGNSRALVKVEDGCNMRCSFCIIPLTRGRQRSRPMPEVIEEIRSLAALGYQEVVITGVQISSYRWQDLRLYELTRAILDQTPISRLRLTSIAPWQFDLRLLELIGSGRLCRHVHLSLQSGCTRTLRRMRRPYDTDDFARLVGRIRGAVAGIAVTTDVIVGFPGETDAESDDSLRFTREMEFARIHAFPFSARPGTEAAEMPDQIDSATKRSRMQKMLEVARSSQRRFEQRHSDTPAEVLWETHRQGSWFGMTDNYLRVVTDCDADLANCITPVRLGSATSGGMTCVLVDPLIGASRSRAPAEAGRPPTAQ